MVEKVIHFVWLHHDGMSENLASYVASWKAHHPSWMVRVWNTQDVATLSLAPWIDACHDVVSKTALASYEIIYRHGGVYCSVDIECLKSVDELLGNEQEPVMFLCEDGNHPESCANMWFAASKEHPALGNLLEHVKKTSLLFQQPKPHGEHMRDLVGPRLFARVKAKPQGKLITLPLVCFYPLAWFEAERQGPFPLSFGVCHW